MIHAPSLSRAGRSRRADCAERPRTGPPSGRTAGRQPRMSPAASAARPPAPSRPVAVRSARPARRRNARREPSVTIPGRTARTTWPARSHGCA
ncbi:hypothetical protein DF17_00915 [Streptomyces rimosus]|nr:hypothetical protein DF17_00915 [Streptomyces rimosus]